MPSWRLLTLALSFLVLPACWEASDDEDPALVSSGGSGTPGRDPDDKDHDDDDDDDDGDDGWHSGGGEGHDNDTPGHDHLVAGWFETLNADRPEGLVVVQEGDRFVAFNRESDGVRRWTSSDARTWSFEEVVVLDASVVPGSVLVRDGAWRMWYTREGARPSIGYATSLDGRTWTLRDPVLEGGPPGAWDALGVRRPSVLFEDGRYRMIFTGLRDGFVPFGAAGYAESPDGLHWSRHPGPVLESAESVNDAWLLRDSGTLRLWYDTRPGRAPSIVQASSVDGLHWSIDGVVLRSDGVLPDREQPTVIRLDGGLRMWLRWGVEAWK